MGNKTVISLLLVMWAPAPVFFFPTVLQMWHATLLNMCRVYVVNVAFTLFQLFIYHSS